MPVQRLINVLAKLAEIHEQLLELAEAKRDALVRNSADEFSAVSNKESKLVRLVGELLQEQADATNDFFRVKGFQPLRSITVTELSRMVTDLGEKEALLSGRDRVTSLTRLLKQKNALNQQLIDQSLGYLNFSVDLIAGPDEEPVYQRPNAGYKSNGKEPGYFDSRA